MVGADDESPGELAPGNLVIAYVRRSALRFECRAPSRYESDTSYFEFDNVVLAIPPDDSTGVAERIRGCDLCGTSAPCGVRCLGGRTQRRFEYFVFHAHHVGLSEVCAGTRTPILRIGVFMLRTRSDVESNARDVAFRSPSHRFLAASPRFRK